MNKNKRLKIAFFMDDFYPSINGVNLVMDNCARNLNKYCDVVIVVPYVDKKYVDNFPYKVIRIKGIKERIMGYTWAAPQLDFKAQKQIKDEHFDLIHIHSPFIMGRVGVLFARKNHIPVVGTIHTRFNYELDRVHLKGICKQIPTNWITKTFNMCDKCFTVNEAMKEIFIKYGITNKISIIPNATDLQTSKNIDEDKVYINNKYNLKENDNVLLFVGRISIVKNIVFILDSLKILKDKNIDFKMLFVGPFEDKKVFYKKIKQLQLEDNIIVCGKVYDREMLSKIYARADLLLLPSYYDTSSLVQKEAASQFTPTVFIENSPTATEVKNDYNGFISPYDFQLYANKIAEVLNNRELLKNVSINCHKSLYRSWSDVCDLLYEEYKKLLSQCYNKDEETTWKENA